MEIYQMKYILVLADELNFSRTAEKLCLTQPAVSRQIKQIEQELEIKIFERDQVKVSITPEGKEFVAHIRTIYDKYEEMQEWLTKRSHIRKIIKLGVSEYNLSLIEDGVKRFCDEYPNLSVEILVDSSPELIDKIRNEMIDMAVVGLPEKKSVRLGLNVFHIKDELLCAVVGNEHAASGKKSIKIDTLSSDKLILRSTKTRIYFELKELLDKYNLENKIDIVPDIEEHYDRLRNGEVVIAKSNALMYVLKGFAMIPIVPKQITEFAIITSNKRNTSFAEERLISYVTDSFVTKSNIDSI